VTAKRSPLIAAHEAGHAVVAVALGLEVRGVYITPHAKKISGYADLVEAPKALWLHDAIVDAAGPAADALSGRYSIAALKRPPVAWQDDFAAITAYGYSRQERDLLVAIASEMLTGRCAKAWREVAAALELGDLTAEQLRALTIEGARAAELL
jgi:hypothetical protein